MIFYLYEASLRKFISNLLAVDARISHYEFLWISDE